MSEQANTELATQAGPQVPGAPGAEDPYAAYGYAVETGTPFLKFIKGVYQFGTDNEVLPIGTRLVPNMAELRSGFIKWKDGVPADEIWVRIAEGKPIPQREDLGDDDRNAWETDPNGTPQDPWQACNTLPMKDPESGQEHIFTTGSRGGIGAVGKLCVAYARQRQKGKLPIIELGSDSYRHRTYGDVSFPTFKIVAWQSEGDLIAGKANEGVVELDDKIPF